MGVNEEKKQKTRCLLDFAPKDWQDSDEFLQAKEEFRKITYNNGPLRKKKLENLIFVQLKEYVRCMLYKHTEKQNDAFISGLKEALIKYNQEKVGDFIVAVAIIIKGCDCVRCREKLHADHLKKVRMIIKHIENSKRILGNILCSKRDSDLEMEPLNEDWQDNILKTAHNKLNDVWEEFNKLQEMLADLAPNHKKGRQPAESDNLAFALSESFYDMLGQPTQTKEGVFYKVLKIVRMTAGLKSEYPSKTIAGAIKTLEYVKKSKEETVSEPPHFIGLYASDWMEDS
jgi:hypothetical protein